MSIHPNKNQSSAIICTQTKFNNTDNKDYSNILFHTNQTITQFEFNQLNIGLDYNHN